MAHALGIDLGTTHTVLASVDNDTGVIADLPITQVTAPGETQALSSLPSLAYLPLAHEQECGALQLPWSTAIEDVVLGAWAKNQAGKVPGRAIVSAKSWLSLATVDRRGAILPWSAPDDVAKMSPVAVQIRLLQHVRASLRHQQCDHHSATLTIPASFDAVARQLTLEAAQAAGIDDVWLLEEPQAAMYAWVARHQHDLRAQLDGVRLVLVIDVGGGTTDLTLLSISPQPSGPPLMTRIAVGDHLMLGGDNMDMALARSVETSLTGAPGTLDAVSFAQLMVSARSAKEGLLSSSPPAEMAVVLPSRGSKLLSGQKSSMQPRAAVEQLVVDGFFPSIAVDAAIDVRNRVGLAEFGLPFEREPSIPRHVLAFLRRHLGAAAETGVPIHHGVAKPDAVLLNGGVFNSPRLRDRMLDIVSMWFGAPMRVLDSGDGGLDAAVARGAAYAAWVRQGHGVRIRGGSARAYFVGIGDGNRALCVVPQGQSEGVVTTIDETLRLTVGTPVSFPLWTSTQAQGIAAGAIIDVDHRLEALPALTTVVQPALVVPVQVNSLLTEVGSLELSLQMTPAALQRFAITFTTRIDGSVAGAPTTGLPSVATLPKRAEEAKELVLDFYGNKAKDVDARKVKDLRRDLEKMLGDRDQWSLALNRELASTLLTGTKRRRRSADHERAFFQLMGFCQRPGIGAAFDDWRIEQLWPLWREGVQHVTEKLTWSSWFILWRRVAGGLSAAQQQEVWAYLKPWLLDQGTGKKGLGPTPSGTDEMVRLAASLERLPASDKVDMGAYVLKKLGRDGLTSHWPLARLGARVPLAATIDTVVSAEVAATWCERVLERDLKTAEHASFALAQMARLTGDRSRDLPLALRERIADRLQKAGAPAPWASQLLTVTTTTEGDNSLQWGDSLPVGLQLSSP